MKKIGLFQNQIILRNGANSVIVILISLLLPTQILAQEDDDKLVHLKHRLELALIRLHEFKQDPEDYFECDSECSTACKEEQMQVEVSAGEHACLKMYEPYKKEGLSQLKGKVNDACYAALNRCSAIIRAELILTAAEDVKKYQQAIQEHKKQKTPPLKKE